MSWEAVAQKRLAERNRGLQRTGSRGAREVCVCAEKAGVGRCRACVEITSNMPPMSVTLDVSSISGWLKACDLSNMLAIFVTLDVLSISGWLKAINPPPMFVQYSLLNILAMFVTLDVSKVSDWLNAFARCRVGRV